MPACRCWAPCCSPPAERLAILLALHATGPLAVTDLALAIGMRNPAVSQALRLLRAAGLVAGEREGRIVRYGVVNPAGAEVLAHGVLGQRES